MTKTTFIARSQWKPDGLNPLTKFVVPQKDIDPKGRRIIFTISTGARDRDGDIIEQNGWLLKKYETNPVVLWSHDAREVIARAENTKVEGGRLISEAIFATRDESAVADSIFRLYKGGFLNATSVGFVPKELELIEGEEPGDIGFRFLKQELLEYSAVAIPSNSEALVIARGEGIDVAPCKAYIERILDEHKGGSVEELLNRCYIALTGRLHPNMQAALAAKNIANLTEPEAEKQPPEDDDDRAILTTGAGGEDGHTHKMREGGDLTEPGGDDGHVHAITYADDGEATIEGAVGHTHDAPAGASMPAAEEDAKDTHDDDEDEDDHKSAPGAAPVAEPDSSAATLAESEDAPVTASPSLSEEPWVSEELADDEIIRITDWPQPGMSLPVSLLTSEYRTFPLAEAKALRDDWPEIWALPWNESGEKICTFITGEAGSLDIRAREAWAAKHVDDYEIEDVVSQIQLLVRGSRGIEHMRLMLSYAKEHVINRRDRAKGLTPEEIDAVTSRVVTRAVIPAIEAAFRKHTGRLS